MCCKIDRGYCMKYSVKRARILGSPNSVGEDLNFLVYVVVLLGK
jgi:hypothetical protein